MAAGRRAAPRWIEGGLIVAATLAMAIAARAPEAGAAWRTAFVLAALTAGGLVLWTARRRSWTTAEVLAVALLLRVLVFPLPPALSDDGFRYVWDGMLQAGWGIDPYQFRPDDAALAFLHDEPVYDRLNSAGFYTVYPPLSQLVFAVGGLAYPLGWLASWYVIKLLVAGAEVAGLVLLSRWVRAPALALYAWHPLVVVEGAGQGHTEALVVGLLLGLVWATRNRRGGVAGVLVALAGWVKLLPCVLAPFVVRRLGRRAAAGLAVAAAVLFVPYASAHWWPHVRASLDLYTGYFEFYAGPYYALKGLMRWATGEDWSKTLGPLLQYTYGGLVLGTLVLALRAKREVGLPVLAVALLGGFLALATTVHPWYLLLVLPFVPLLVERAGTRLLAAAWLWLSVSSMATYWRYAGPAWGYPAAVAVGWAGWALLTAAWAGGRLLPGLMRRRGADKWRRIARLIPPLAAGTKVLDLGAGEGYVGAAVHQQTGADVTLADVVDFHRVALPFHRYDGRTLPFADDSFDTTLLVFVLHHAGDPNRVLREAARVTHGLVVVQESVFANEPQRVVLTVLDRWANRIRSGGRMRGQEEALHFRTEAGWQAAFEREGLRVRTTFRRGRWIHRQAVFVLEREERSVIATAPNETRLPDPASAHPPTDETT